MTSRRGCDLAEGEDTFLKSRRVNGTNTHSAYTFGILAHCPLRGCTLTGNTSCLNQAVRMIYKEYQVETKNQGEGELCNESIG
jgi:hypothetical protein